MVAASAVAGMTASAAAAPMMDFRTCMLAPASCRLRLRWGGSPAKSRSRHRSQGVLTLHEKTVRERMATRWSRCALGHPFRVMSRRVAALALTALLAFPGVVLADDIGGTRRADNLVGTAGPDTIKGLGGNDTIRGRGGSDHLFGGRGNDTISGDSGNDVIQGGAGDDTLLGGAGKDRISGGPGADVIAAGNGNDVVRARDGVVDQNTCGPGHDRVIADPQDSVARDCEVVQRG